MAGEDNTLKTGTTTIGLKIKDGIILASDQRATMGNLIANSNVQKVYQLSDNLGMTIAGSVGDAQLMVRYMQSEISIYCMKRGSQMSVNAAATLVASVIRQGFYLGLIVGGYDATGGHVFSIDGAGGYIEDNYMSIGSGSVFAYGALEAYYKTDMTKKDAIDVAITALNSARRRDNCTGDGMLISFIGSKGYESIPQDQIKVRCAELGFKYPN
ncbi:MAG: proteasome subunit beta [Candidatus Methanomethylophilaceae archaeon]|nr:proteasome subunit beta [Candidatus Methanomethylophilaceae archaeon]MCK9323050.1 proteasome subunit beta [Candidatus Methanomethylophilaceae archaeon]MDD3379201.1 proteasome subunit beta [Candidatus Methanomethylophilaceae archaeon]